MKHSRRTLFAAAFAAAAGLLAVPVTGFAQAQPGTGITINIGYFPVVSPVPIMRTQQQLEKKGYTVNWVPITQGLPGAASAVIPAARHMTIVENPGGTADLIARFIARH